MPQSTIIRKNGTARDNQRQRLYDAEDAARHRLGLHGHRIANGDLQAFVDKVMVNRAVQSRYGFQRLTVGLTHGGGRAWTGANLITLGTWARNELVILHEIAHHLMHDMDRKAADHGPEFAGVLKFLTKTILGKDAYDVLCEEFKKGRVRSNNTCVPAPEVSRVRTQADRNRAKRERDATDRWRSRSKVRRVAAAETIRAMVHHGDFGASGSKERTRALALARQIESRA